MGIQEMVGAGPTINFAGEELTVSGKTFRHLGEISAQMMAERPKPFDSIRELAPIWKSEPELAKSIIEECFLQAKTWNSPTLFEIMEYFLESWNGQIMGYWLSIRDNDRQKWTLQKFREEFCDEYERITRKSGFDSAKEWTVEWSKKIDMASGDGEMGNSYGSPNHSPEQTESLQTTSTSSVS